MNPGLIGVAISTTGDPHRLGPLHQCVQAWTAALPEGSPVFVTIDGDEAAVARVVGGTDPDEPVQFYRVGQADPARVHARPAGLRQGVAVNKNTGLELLMDAGVEHLFLGDDDTWPLYNASLGKHMNYAHSAVCWGSNRLERTQDGYAVWSWPRGVMLHAHRSTVEAVGGMDERFGPGGHEHVEWSQRIHNAGLTPEPFISPASYATRNAMGAAALWHAEDMPQPGEARHAFHRRKAAQTTIHTTRDEWQIIDRVMASREGSADFVDYRAQASGRASATLFQNIPSQGAEESK